MFSSGWIEKFLISNLPLNDLKGPKKFNYVSKSLQKLETSANFSSLSLYFEKSRTKDLNNAQENVICASVAS